MSDLYHVSSSPHVRAKDTTGRIMLYVILALLPTSLFGIYNFGVKALILILVTIASCVASEWVFNKIVHKEQTIKDLSAVVTGLLLALNLPVNLPWWEAVIGGVFAIIVVKCLFGGLGQNFMNPALGARCFLLIAFAADMTNFVTDTYTGATPLAALRNGEAVNTMNMLVGRTSGTIGETSAIAILIGAILFLYPIFSAIDFRLTFYLHLPNLSSAGCLFAMAYIPLAPARLFSLSYIVCPSNIFHTTLVSGIFSGSIVNRF